MFDNFLIFRNVRHAKRSLEQIFICKDKVRTARLLNHVTQSGHTVISWAAAYGEYEVFRLLFFPIILKLINDMLNHTMYSPRADGRGVTYAWRYSGLH